jgi:hypothetical protein
MIYSLFSVLQKAIGMFGCYEFNLIRFFRGQSFTLETQNEPNEERRRDLQALPCFSFTSAARPSRLAVLPLLSCSAMRK